MDANATKEFEKVVLSLFRVKEAKNVVVVSLFVCFARRSKF